MKTKFTSVINVLFAIFLIDTANAQNTFPSTGAAGIGTISPNSSSLLEIKSTAKGFLMSRMSKAQRDAIASPTEGLLIYQTNNTPGFYYYSGSAWKAVATKAGWSLTGNANTDSSVNFLGTTDAHPLAFRVNNKKAGWIDFTGNNNTSFGYQGLLANSTGFYNTAVGYNSLKGNIEGGRNTAIGAYALLVNTADNNTAIGTYALAANTIGTGNTATGYNTLVSNLQGNSNAAYGTNGLASNTDGNENTALGSATLNGNITGNDNTATGFAALNWNNANNNTATGAYALYNNKTGYNNVAIGTHALYSNKTRSRLVAIGDSALYNNVASFNTAVGSKALFSNTTGWLNSAIGFEALHSNNTGDDNTAHGYHALYNNSTGSDNTATGAWALLYNVDGSNNTAQGQNSLIYNISGSENTANGNSALLFNTYGNFNTGIGSLALGTNTVGGYNTALGYRSDVSVNNLINATAIGANAIVNDYNKIRLGDESVSLVESQNGVFTASDGRFKNNIKENVKGLEFIKLLKPVTYNFDTKKFSEFLMQNFPDSIKIKRMAAMNKNGVAKSSGILQTGFVAQDVAEVAKRIGYDFNGVHAPENPTGNWSLSYEKLVVPLVKAVQELSKMNDDKDTKINNLQKQIDELKAMIVSNQPTINSQQSTVISPASLQQNIPNPFSNTTTINYTLSQKFTSAQIVITDKSGKTLKAINIYGNQGNVKVDASTLASGAYQYSLIVDGKLIGTNQMILTK